MNVLEATATRLKLGPEPASEGTPWKRLGGWVKGHLRLMDRGDEDFHLFYRIAQNGGFFLIPLKAGRNPKLMKSLRKWRGTRRTKRWKCRLIGIQREDGTYWLHLTNLTPEMMPAEDVWKCDRLRWQVELVIRRMRQHLSLDEMTSQKAEVVEALLWASV